MLTLNAADEPERGFTADFSVVWPAMLPTQPWLSEVRDDTVPLVWPPTGTSTCSAMVAVDIAPKGGLS